MINLLTAAVLTLIEESIWEILLGVATIVALILTRGKNADQIKAIKQKKLAKLKAANTKATAELQSNLKKEAELEEELKNVKS